MTTKTWTATDVELGKLTVHRVTQDGNPAIQVERRYQFLGATGLVLEQLSGGRILETIVLSALPADILAALQKIDLWTREKALEQEGML